ncbi:MAG TPA: hypothetical protein PLV50_12975 [Smithella sp.]|nr:hypothetical protein [Smithella sp.]MDM7988624.1 hypothetical protein [Smithella sp.]HNY51312.1 hypothetical protein [Smithella sp.]HOG91448.1 hypothetical protein [Smithella sp.]HOU51375.1 hypothetical protein [Smithella sp.]
MKKISYWLLIVAVAMIVVACGKDEPELNSIHPGLYEISHDIKYAGQLIVLKQRVRYNANGTYEATNFQNNAALEELRGKYKVENKQLVSYDTQRRLIAQEGTWSQNKSVSKVDVRKIKKSSYQYYFKYPDEQTREKYKGLGLSEGWKTYKRISD